MPSFYYNGLDYIKNQSNTISKEKPTTNTIYKNILSPNNNIFGETMQKIKILNINFAKIWK